MTNEERARVGCGSAAMIVLAFFLGYVAGVVANTDMPLGEALARALMFAIGAALGLAFLGWLREMHCDARQRRRDP